VEICEKQNKTITLLLTLERQILSLTEGMDKQAHSLVCGWWKAVSKLKISISSIFQSYL
jgi:hypothetical protein